MSECYLQDRIVMVDVTFHPNKVKDTEKLNHFSISHSPLVRKKSCSKMVPSNKTNVGKVEEEDKSADVPVI